MGGEGKCVGDCVKGVGSKGDHISREETPWRTRDQRDQYAFKVLKMECSSGEQNVGGNGGTR